jgi:fermentation-respiration switch protein FrsA (DUF1100 family)
MWLLHGLLLCGYAATPVLYTAALLARWHAGRSRAALRDLMGTAAAAILLGGAVAIFFAVAVGARPRYDQALLASFYFMTVVLVLKGLLHAGRRLAGRLTVTSAIARLVTRRPSVRPILSALCQTVLVFFIGLPYVMAAVMTYRPKVAIVGDPRTALHWPFEAVAFKAADGVPLSAWWIPGPPNRAHPENAGRTVVVCHGLGANKLNQLPMARLLYPLGYNVLAFDFRAHGGSGGQFTTYGDHERRDVLAAVGWLKSNHPREARQVVGLGASLGAAALIAAATEETSPLSRDLDAVIVYGTYADLGQLTREVPDRFPWPLNLLATHLAVPIASLHANANLRAFAPVRTIARLAPRPLLIVHGRQDEIIPPHHGQDLFDAAGEPKQLILLDGDHNGVIDDDGAARAIADFLDRHLPR